MCVEKYLKDKNIKEGSCNIIYKINLTGMSILFSNKGMGCQRRPIGLSSIIYWAKKNQNCRQPKLDSSSGQIYWVISHHQYISRSRYAGEGENYRLKGTARCWRLAQQMLISWTKQQHHWFKKDKWKRKKDVGITVPEVLIMAKNTFNSPVQWWNKEYILLLINSTTSCIMLKGKLKQNKAK